MPCQATAEDHCCWLDGEVCPHFDPSPPADAGGHCALRTELGSWDAVAADPRYVEIRSKSRWLQLHPGAVCGDYPDPTTDGRCATCGATDP